MVAYPEIPESAFPIDLSDEALERIERASKEHWANVRIKSASEFAARLSELIDRFPGLHRE